jgi:hypothetical protein
MYTLTYVGGTSDVGRSEYFTSIFSSLISQIHKHPIALPIPYITAMIKLFEKYTDHTLTLIYYYCIATSNSNIITVLDRWKSSNLINKHCADIFDFTPECFTVDFILLLQCTSQFLNLYQLIELHKEYKKCMSTISVDFIYRLYSLRIHTKQSITVLNIISKLRSISQMEIDVIKAAVMDSSNNSFVVSFLNSCISLQKVSDSLVNEFLKEHISYFSAVEYSQFIEIKKTIEKTANAQDVRSSLLIAI